MEDEPRFYLASASSGLPVSLDPPEPNPVPQGIPKSSSSRQPRPITIVRADRPGLTCCICDEPAPYRIMVDGQLRESVCKGHKMRQLAKARRANGRPFKGGSRPRWRPQAIGQPDDPPRPQPTRGEPMLTAAVLRQELPAPSRTRLP